jgi:hypothetical protein
MMVPMSRLEKGDLDVTSTSVEESVRRDREQENKNKNAEDDPSSMTPSVRNRRIWVFLAPIC